MSNLINSPYTDAIRQALLKSSIARVPTVGRAWKLRRSKVKHKKECMIYLEINYLGEEVLLTTGIQTLPKDFDRKTGKISGNPEGTMLLQTMHTAVYRAYEQIRLMEHQVTARLIRDVVLGVSFGKTTAVRVTVAIDKFLSHQKDRVSTGEIDAHTLRSKKRHNELFLSYLTQAYCKSVYLDQICPGDSAKFIVFLKKQLGHTHNYAIKVVSAAKELLFFAVANKFISHNPFANHRNKKEEKMGEILTEREVDTLANLTNLSPGLIRARDVFMFQIFSGLCYRDIRDLTAKHILTTEQGGRYFRKPRQKTGTVSIVPIIPQAQSLLEKYANCPERGEGLMPVVSNTKMNDHLKKIAQKANLTKRLTTHVARRTCATMLINNNVPLTTVAMILGHSNTIITQRSYAKVNPETVIRDMQNFANREPK